MLWLKRVTRFNELLRCWVTLEPIGPGDYYYEDDEDGFIVKATVYRDLLNKRKYDQFDYKVLNNAQDQRSYKEELRKAEREYLTQTMFDRKIAGKEGFDADHIQR